MSMNFRTEDDYWDDYYDRMDEAKREIIREAEFAADLDEFDTDEEREDYIKERIRQGLEELELAYR